jgi:hypothetical protein|tara:strand:- start:679 stop:909 length:231 start_codon:yes stop_codon:yes gene_type:complete
MKENIGSENNKVIEKILQHIQEDKIESKKDLKLYGVDKPELQKELMWDIFENYVMNEQDRIKKSTIIRKFHRANLL